MTTTQFRVLPTEYQGVTFRSRTEARWAVLFDALSIGWEYEPEGFELEGVRYLPDFWLPTLRRWVEIKGERPTAEEQQKATWLADATSHDVLMAWGAPKMPDGSWGPLDDSMWLCDAGGWDYAWWWCECPHCGFVDATFNGRAARLSCGCVKRIRGDHEDKAYAFDTPHLAAAFAATRAAFSGPAFKG